MSSLCKIEPWKSDESRAAPLPFGQGFLHFSDSLPPKCGKKLPSSPRFFRKLTKSYEFFV